MSRTTSSSVACIEVSVIRNREDIVSFQIQILGVLFMMISKKVYPKKNMKDFFNLTDFSQYKYKGTKGKMWGNPQRKE